MTIASAVNESSDSPRLTASDVARVERIFASPLRGSYCWDYESADQKIKKLYELGKSLNWNASDDIDWNKPLDRERGPMAPTLNPMMGFEGFEALSEPERLEFAWRNFAWILSQFLHGEQGALLVASQLISCAPTYDAKLFAASQTFDEARHVEVFSRYLKERVGIEYEVNPMLKALLDKILTDERWDLKLIGMQVIIEGLALAAFKTFKMASYDPVFVEMIDFVLRDESRHVGFGIGYLEQILREMSEPEIEERARFAYEACVVMRERLIAFEVFDQYGWDREQSRNRVLSSQIMQMFRHSLFERIIPNLKRVGLLTPSVRPLYEKMGVLSFEHSPDDGAIDWAVLGAPLAGQRKGG
jgi:hypothetical protein